jgi:tetratricopeptide (TPR) repeat protein
MKSFSTALFDCSTLELSNRNCRMWRGYLFGLLVGICSYSISSVLGYSLAEANALKQRKDWDAVLKYGQAWTQAEPNNSNAWGVIAIAYLDGFNRPDLALEPTRRGIALTPKEPGVWSTMGWIYKKLNRHSEAVDAFSHAVDLAPHNGTYWNNLAVAYWEEDNYRMALQTLEKQAQNAGPYQNAQLWYNLGIAFKTIAASTSVRHEAGRSFSDILREAVNAYQQCLKINPRSGDAWNELGVMAEALGDRQSALNDYQRAASLGAPFGQQNFIALQNTIAAEKARGDAVAAANAQVPSWIRAKERAQWAWGQSYYLQHTQPFPQ